MNNWLGKQRKVYYEKNDYFVEEITDIGDTWVTIKTIEESSIYEETFYYDSNSELIDSLSLLNYK